MFSLFLGIWSELAILAKLASRSLNITTLNFVNSALALWNRFWLLISQHLSIADLIVIASTATVIAFATASTIALVKANNERLKYRTEIHQTEIEIQRLRAETEILARAIDAANTITREINAANTINGTAAAGKTPAVPRDIVWGQPRVVSPFATPFATPNSTPRLSSATPRLLSPSTTPHVTPRLASATPRPVSPPTTPRPVSPPTPCATPETTPRLAPGLFVDTTPSTDPLVEFIGCFPAVVEQIRDAFYKSEAKYVIYTCRPYEGDWMSITIINRSWSIPRHGAILWCGVIIEMLPASGISRSNKLRRLIPAIQGFAAMEKGISRRVLENVSAITLEEQHQAVAERLESLLSGDINEAWSQLWPGPKPQNFEIVGVGSGN